HEVDLAADEALKLHRVVWNRAVAKLVQVRLAVLRAPVALEALRGQVIVLDPLDKLERPGSDGLAPEVWPELLDRVRRDDHASTVGQGRQKGGVRTLEVQLDGELVDDLGVLDVGDLAGPDRLGGRVLHPVEVELDGV